MKKSNVNNNLFIISFILILSRILSSLYVIPFYSVIGEKGGALFGYSISIVLLFISLSCAGFPFAISKLVSEYNNKGFYKHKKRVLKIGSKLSFLVGLSSFIILILVSPLLVKFIFGSDNSNITFLVRLFGFVLLILPIYNVYKGYALGHKDNNSYKISNSINDIIKYFIIIFGSLLVVKVFKLSINTAVGISLYAFSVSSLIGYFYLVKKFKIKHKLYDSKEIVVKEGKINNLYIIKKIFVYSIPFIMIDVFYSLFNYVDLFTGYKNLISISGYSKNDSYNIMGIIIFWANNFNIILIGIVTYLLSLLTPHLKNNINKSINEVSSIINNINSKILFIMVPVTFLISGLSKPIWNLFYGSSKYGSSILSIYIFVGLMIGLYMTKVSVFESFKDYKSIFVSLLFGFITKLILNVNLIDTYVKMGIPSYYGIISATFIGYLVAYITLVIILNKKYHINYEDTVKHFIDIMVSTFFMFIMLFLLKFIIPIDNSSRFISLLSIIFYSFVGMSCYLFISRKNKSIESIFKK